MAVDAVSRRQDFDPWQSRTFTVALQTAARPHLASAIGLSGPFYTRETPLLWGRPLADGSLLFGRELIEWPGWSPPADWRQRFTASVERLAARVRGLHPELRDVGIERAWSGPTARTIAGVPTLVEDPDVPGVIWAGGYGGHGLAQAFTLGRAAADRVAGERT
jgi:glycine/D-amino acid oxidase-like deaminating enzyme